MAIEIPQANPVDANSLIGAPIDESVELEDGQFLIYDSASKKWVPSAGGGGGGLALVKHSFVTTATTTSTSDVTLLTDVFTPVTNTTHLIAIDANVAYGNPPDYTRFAIGINPTYTFEVKNINIYGEPGVGFTLLCPLMVGASSTYLQAGIPYNYRLKYSRSVGSASASARISALNLYIFDLGIDLGTVWW